MGYIINKIKYCAYGTSLGIIAWSIWIDLATYNVIYPTDKNIALYCLDGLIFNYKKILLPLIIYYSIKVVYENRLNRCRQS